MRKTRRINRRRFIQGTIFGFLGLGSTFAIDSWLIEPEWLDIVELDLNLKNLPQAFVGKRLIQISDLHCGRAVGQEYLWRCTQRINQLKPDIVVLTGDYITYDRSQSYTNKVLQILGGINSRYGVYACLGNHDYGIWTRWKNTTPDVMNNFVDGLPRHNIQLLRNQSVAVTIDDERIWMVGLGDLWAKDLHPARAFNAVPADEATIVLTHNPDSIEHFENYSADAILCGHTHGGQVRLPLIGSPLLPIKNRQYDAGMFDFQGKTLYVNRGIGRLGRFRFNCRPEITVFTLNPTAT